MKTSHGKRISTEYQCTNAFLLVVVEDELLQLQAIPCRFNDRVFWGSIHAQESRQNCWINSVHKEIVSILQKRHVQSPETSADNASDYEEFVTNQTHFKACLLRVPTMAAKQSTSPCTLHLVARSPTSSWTFPLVFVFSFCQSLVVFIFESG